MTADHALGPAAPVLLARHATYYREKAAECQRLLDDMEKRIRSGSPELVTTIARERDLWTQLANEIETYLEADDGPGLF